MRSAVLFFFGPRRGLDRSGFRRREPYQRLPPERLPPPPMNEEPPDLEPLQELELRAGRDELELLERPKLDEDV